VLFVFFISAFSFCFQIIIIMVMYRINGPSVTVTQFAKFSALLRSVSIAERKLISEGEGRFVILFCGFIEN